MGEAFIVRRGGVSSEETAAPTITIISEDSTGVTFTLTNNDDNTALITFEIDDTLDVIELAAAAVSANITVALAAGTYTLTAFATVVGEVATSATVSVEIVVIEYEELFELDVTTAVTQIDITNLSIGKDDTLRLVFTAVGSSTSTHRLRVFPNDLTTNTNYHTQRLLGTGSTTFATRTNENNIAFFRSNSKVAGFADIKVSENDRFVMQSQTVSSAGSQSSSIENENQNTVGTQTVSSITKLSLICDVTNGIAVGSKIALYKVTEAA